MIRGLLALTVAVVLILVFHVPSTRDAQFFLDQIKAEHALTTAHWGPDIATRILRQASDTKMGSTGLLPIPSATDGPQFRDTSAAVTREMNEVNQRLFGNRYFQSIRQLQALASYRLSHLMYWLPWFAAFLLANLADGALHRRIRSKGLNAASPEAFGLLATAATLVVCATGVALLLPTLGPPVMWPSMLAIGAALIGQLLASFHTR